ncbi:hypothetical protein CEXT_222871 [Caerostris extrusa]|uniref:Uncharacterized protein n=1 Tax=Caerostris extrusa TaxID=172846 RepID=A0AAV4NLA0_CAEEX|nr:hypothetical protein CEXT_222871 [Caerostris extrusa]
MTRVYCFVIPPGYERKYRPRGICSPLFCASVQLVRMRQRPNIIPPIEADTSERQKRYRCPRLASLSLFWQSFAFKGAYKTRRPES